MSLNISNRNVKYWIKNFFLCGCIGWCFECFWTGIGDWLKDKDLKFSCHTSLWMFPIYGCASFLPYLKKRLTHFCLFFRGIIYMLFIYLGEFLSGILLQKFDLCPWDYSKSRLNYRGLVRLDYAPVWFLVGLLYETFLTKIIIRKSNL